MSLQLLCIGDLHLGRPVRAPSDALEQANLAFRDIQPEAAWNHAVEYAVSQQVDAVVLAGDVVDRDDFYLEAYGPLEVGARRLAEAGVDVYAVAGNHDVNVLPRLAAAIDSVHVIGKAGQWEAADLPDTDLRLVGWSFSAAQATANPLERLDGGLLQSGPATVIGLLHCDLGASGGRYAPVPRVGLEDLPTGAWLLGHVHNPDNLAGMVRPIGYLGSLAGLDVTERGPHGPWVLTLEHGNVRLAHLPMASLRWERVDVSLEGAAARDDVEERAVQALGDLHARLRDQPGAQRIVGCRLHLTGRSEVYGELPAVVTDMRQNQLWRELDDVVYFVDDYNLSAVRPCLDLETLAHGDSPPAVLARMLLSLEAGDDQAMELVRDASVALRGEAQQTAWDGAGNAALLDGEAVRSRLLERGMPALEALLRQQPVIEQALAPSAPVAAEESAP